MQKCTMQLRSLQNLDCIDLFDQFPFVFVSSNENQYLIIVSNALKQKQQLILFMELVQSFFIQ